MMEMEKEGGLPFGDVFVYHRSDGNLGYKVYRKPAHTDQYLKAFRHHHTCHMIQYLFYIVWVIK